MTADTAQVDDLTLVALPSAVSCAEMFVRFTLAEWSLHLLRDDAAEAIRQLVAAAVDNDGSPTPGFITVRLRLRGDCLLIEVDDEQSVQRRGVAPAPKGTRTGVVPLAKGKRTWCEVPLPSGLTASSVPLPRREPRRSPEAERLAGEPDEFDPQIMQRILFGLGGTSNGQFE